MEGKGVKGAKGAKEAKVKQPRAKKGAAVVPVADSVVSAFGGAIEPKPEQKPEPKEPNPEPKEPIPAIFIEEVEQPIVPTPKSKKSSKRKPAVVASVTPEGIQGSLVAEQRPLIAHLPIHISDIDNDLFAPTPSLPADAPIQPNPYDSDEMLAVFGVGPIAPAAKRGLSGVLYFSQAARAI
jgi:hypothetical protein